MKNKIKKFLEKGNISNQGNRKNAGITLVALVITIIILLILAGISIAQLTGNGLFEKAKLAKEISKNAQDDENDKIAKYGNEIDSYVVGDRTSGVATYNYSYDEQVVGKWVDGKPLYQKTIKATTPSTSSAANISDLPDNYENIFIANAFIITSDSVLPLAFNDGNQRIWIRLESNTAGSRKIAIATSNTNRPVFITLQYTKTTD